MKKLKKEKNIENMKGLNIDELETILKELAKTHKTVIRWKNKDITTGKITYKVISN